MKKAEKDKLITEFMGYKLVPWMNGRAWERATFSSIHDTFNLHGRLWRETDNYYKWSSDWNWLMEACKKFDQLTLDKLDYEAYVAHCDGIDDLVTCYEKEPVYDRLVEAIEWYNEQINQ